MITTCTKCSRLFEAVSEEQANEPQRLCFSCRAPAPQLGIVKAVTQSIEHNADHRWQLYTHGRVDVVETTHDMKDAAIMRLCTPDGHHDTPVLRDLFRGA